MTGWKTAIHSAVPCLIILFVGSWSDRHARRKPCILIPLVGEIITAFGLLFCVYFENTPIEFAIFVEVFFPSITGLNSIQFVLHTQHIMYFFFVPTSYVYTFSINNNWNNAAPKIRAQYRNNSNVKVYKEIII